MRRLFHKTVMKFRDFFDEASKNEHRVVTNAWTMVDARLTWRQEMLVVTADFNAVFKLECLLKVCLNWTSINFVVERFFPVGSRIGRQSNLFKHHMRKRSMAKWNRHNRRIFNLQEWCYNETDKFRTQQFFIKWSIRIRQTFGRDLQLENEQSVRTVKVKDFWSDDRRKCFRF